MKKNITVTKISEEERMRVNTTTSLKGETRQRIPIY